MIDASQPCSGSSTGALVGATVVFLAMVASAALAGGPPATGSPGSATAVDRIAGPCPTFSWGLAGEVDAYELAVHRLDDEAELLRRTLPGSARSWTPDLDECLHPGGRYAWTIRALGPDGASDWSEPRLFEVARGADPDDVAAALEIVREYLASGAVDARAAELVANEGESIGVASWSRQDPLGAGPTSAQRAVAVGPPSGTPRMPVAADADLQVDGSPVVTVATLGGALCGATELRYLDQGDGTVLDCNTGKIWLKHANCLDQWAYDHPSEPTIFDKIEELNTGVDFGCADYAAGTYTDWRIPDPEELCGLWDGSCTGSGCCDASQGLYDPGYSGHILPAIANARGDDRWSDDDAFVITDFGEYWTTLTSTAGRAWSVDLRSGVTDATVDGGNYLWPVRGSP